MKEEEKKRWEITRERRFKGKGKGREKKRNAEEGERETPISKNIDKWQKWKKDEDKIKERGINT